MITASILDAAANPARKVDFSITFALSKTSVPASSSRIVDAICRPTF